MTVEDTSAVGFEPPGDGSWQRDPVHFPRPVTRYFAEVHPEAFKRGFRAMTSYYGLLLDTMEYGYVNGFGYSCAHPVTDDEVPARFQRAEEVLEGKLWREQLREWDETAKPASIAKHRELQAVDPEALSDEELVDYLGRCREHHAEMISQHMRFTGGAMLPTGDLLAHAGEWTDVPPSELLAMLRGSAPVSAGASEELTRLREALAEDASARELVESEGDPGEVLAALRNLDSEAGRAASDYLDLVGCRLLDGFDISNRYALEMPDALLRSIRAAAANGADDGGSVEALTAEIRSQVPEEHRAQFDELVEEARLTYRLRDERGVFSDIWASGLMRRAVMAGGRRLAAAGRLHDAEHFVEAGFDEMRALLEGAAEPSADELAARFEKRTTAAPSDAPLILGDPPPPRPDPSGLPPAPGRVMRAIGIAIDSLFGSSEEPHEEDRLRGLAASGGVYDGPARRVSGPEEFDRIQKGDVLLTESTTEAFNILLPLLGAIVTDSGGLLSHSAIVAREYGIPGVVGTRDATSRIPDGARVQVDGDAGEVTVHG
ncbi:MAG TPA: PEP-utilizing enzyme [Solirubrobacterales bacterium]|nr:PEP-utilizing enzyme [Solirubrobacterales bacterium]